MGWQYDYSINTVRGASSGTSLSDLAAMVRLPNEVGAGKRESNKDIPYRHGNVGDSAKKSPGFLIPLELDLRYTNSAGAVTHTNGEAGHVYENLYLLRQLLAAGTGWFGKDDPHGGRLEIPFEVVLGPTTTTPRHRVFTQLRTTWPFWSEETQRTGLGTSFTLDGTAPVADAVLRIVGGTDVKVTHDQSGDYFQLEGATPAGGIDIDCGLRKSTNVTGGASAEHMVEHSAAHWMELEPGSVTFTVTGGGTLTVALYEQYR